MRRLMARMILAWLERLSAAMSSAERRRLQALAHRLQAEPDAKSVGEKLGACGENCLFGSFLEIRNPENVFVGCNVQINSGVILRPRTHKITIGDHTGINPYVAIYGKVSIGKYNMIAPHVMLAGGNHAIDDTETPMSLSGRSSNEGIVTEDDVWLGANAVVLDGVRIGHGAVVAAGAVVTRDVAPFDVVAGNPARRIKNRKEARR